MANNPIRMARLQKNGIIMVPMDHGVSMGPAPGIRDPQSTLAGIAHAATCITVHKGLVPIASEFADRLGILMHLSASTDANADPNDKRLVGTVAEAARVGCDGVSVHVNVGAHTESRMVADLGAVATACQDHGMPLVAMMYPRGPRVTDPFDADLIAHAARLGGELGADVVKVPLPKDPSDLYRATEGCPVPVIISGGPKAPDFDAFVDRIRAGRDAGAAGVSIGRNVFQHSEPSKAAAELRALWS